ncbi:PAS domain S-box protein [bacterium]|nr:PAS domain S-box protein [bacterium]MBU1958456.1 PAS domain S-box protein [bacterium]
MMKQTNFNETQELLQLDNQYQALFEYSNDAIFIHDLEGKILEVNKRAEAMFGRSKKEFLTLYTHDLPYKNGKERCKEAMKILKENGFVFFECEFISKDKTVFPVKVSASLIKINDISLVQAIVRDVSQEKETIAALQNSNEQYQSLFENTAFGALIIDEQTMQVLNCNKMASDMLGINLNSCNKWNATILHQNLSKDQLEEHIYEVAQHHSHSYNSSVIDKNGKKRELLISCRQIQFNGISSHLSILVDITEKKNYERELEEKNQQLKKSKANLIEAQKIAHIGNWELNLITNQLTWSDEVYRIFDLEVHEFKANYQAFLDNIHPDDKEKVNHAYLKSIEDKKPYHIIHRLITKNGTLKYVEERCEHILDEQQNIIRSIGTIQDISKRKTVEIELRKSKKNYQSILDNMQDTYYRTNLKGELVYVSKSVETLSGYSSDELLGQPLANFYRDPSIRDNFLKNMLANNGKLSFQAELVHRNKSIVWLHTNSRYWRKDNGDIGGVEGFARDITQEKQAQEKEKRLLDLIEASSNEIYVFDKKSLCFNYVNQGGIANLQYTPSELYTKHPYDIKPKFTEKSFREYIQPLIDNTVTEQRFETLHQRKDGSTYPVLVHLQLLHTKFAEEFLAVIIDISEQEKMNKKIKEQEEIMLVQSRHAAMGEMISMIAHQWRQPISIVGMLANSMKHTLQVEKMDTSRAMQEDLQTISDQVQYMSKTIDDFRNFFQKSNAIEEVNLYYLLIEAKSILGAVFQRHNIKLIIDCPIAITLHTYSRELVQVFVNILSNAKDALGKVSDEKNIIIHVVEQEETIEISIFNNGFPIKESIKNKIFEPYFTTKGNFGGTGLGLYMVKSILDKHMNGKIAVENKKNGVAFNITLPKILELD